MVQLATRARPNSLLRIAAGVAGLGAVVTLLIVLLGFVYVSRWYGSDFNVGCDHVFRDTVCTAIGLKL